MEQFAVKLLGFAAATCTTLAYAPQFVKVWRTRSTEDISLGMFLVMVLGILLWLLYGLLSGDAPLIVAIVALLFGRLEFRFLLRGNTLRRA
jgi:MtN3 and saliva related transmembrane protein